MDLKKGSRDFRARRVAKTGGGRIAEFALVEGAAGRRATGKLERQTNEYQAELLRAYDKWAKEAQAALTRAEREGVGEAGIIAALEVQLLKLSETLKEIGRKGIREAVVLGQKGREPDVETLELITEEVKQNEKFIDESLIPAIKEKIEKHITEESKSYALDQLALAGALAAVRSRTGGYSGSYWAAIFRGAGILRKREDIELKKQGVKPRRVRWVLDPGVEHCHASAGFYGCMDMAGEYDNWDAMPTVPAGQVTCRGNCRCHIEVRNDQGGWSRVT